MAAKPDRSVRKKTPPKPKTAKKAGGKPGVGRSSGAKKKRAGSRRSGKKRGLADIRSQLRKGGIAVLILVALCLTGAMVADIMIKADRDRPSSPAPAAPPDRPVTPPKQNPPPSSDVPDTAIEPVFEDISGVAVKKPHPGLMSKAGHPIIYEVFDRLDHGPKAKDGQTGTAVDGEIRIALVIDDIGYDKQIAMALCDLEPNISFSVLPWSPFGRVLSEQLKARGAEIMLHLPMEPMEYPDVNPGPGALLTSMPPDVLLTQLEKNLAEIRGVAGVNNHMGSRLTSQADQMNQVFTILKKRHLFFIDSLTAPDSQCRASARLLQLRFAQRDVFLDNVQEVSYISGQFAQLKRVAMKHGTAIGIGHPYPATLETLKIELPKIEGKIKIVPAGRLVTVPG